MGIGISLILYLWLLISEDVKDLLCKPVSNAEILQAVKQLGPLKAHGKDGFSGFFSGK